MRNLLREILAIQTISHISTWQLMYGAYRLSRLQGPIISVLGGKGAWEEGKYQAQASRFAALCAQHRYAVITGGGPGIMEAANCGVREIIKSERQASKFTLGIGVKGVDVGYTNPCAPVFSVNYYYVREWLLIRYSKGFAFFPGGIGTVDELFSLLNLIKLKKLARIPIVLIDKDYWKGLIDWYAYAVELEFIAHENNGFFTIADDADEAFSIIGSNAKK